MYRPRYTTLLTLLALALVGAVGPPITAACCRDKHRCECEHRDRSHEMRSPATCGRWFD